jgi:hypothetical protein
LFQAFFVRNMTKVMVLGDHSNTFSPYPLKDDFIHLNAAGYFSRNLYPIATETKSKNLVIISRKTYSFFK